MRVRSGSIIHDANRPLRILGGDPGSTTGLVCVEFRSRYEQSGAPLWDGARLLGAATVARPSKDDAVGATEAERDILFRRNLISVISDVLGPRHIVDIVALEEPLDGMSSWAGDQRKNDGEAKGVGIQARSTPFRIGASYGALLAAAAYHSPNRVISFPVKAHKGRAGWMKSRRKTTLQVSTALFKMISMPGQQAAVMKRDRSIPDHILMALGVVNHLVNTYTDHFPSNG